MPQNKMKPAIILIIIALIVLLMAKPDLWGALDYGWLPYNEDIES